ncbi:MAG: undecaprenyl-diphosphate phosphatase [Candidatus Micrarchaeota archaeon]|nr:undecaprenyl-diphosphate phosphatase [Candidatus Micrarchaeota archaeon]
MDIFQAIVLGIVQAVTEWLPLSSKTMDTLVYTRFFGGSMGSVVSVLLFLHIGTLLAATVYFRAEIFQVARKFLSAPTDWRMHRRNEVGFLITALFFTGVVGIPLLAIEKLFLPTLEANALLTLMGAGLVLTGFLLSTQKKNRWKLAHSACAEDGVLTGLLQGLSVIPGVSRAGCTTSALIWKGFDAESAFHLSFLLSIPSVFVAEVVIWVAQGGISALPLVDGLMLIGTSFVFGYATIKVLLEFAHKINVASLAFVFGIMMLIFGLVGVG